MDSTQVENTTTAPVMEKKRIVKKKIIRVKKEENTSETKEVAAPVIEKSVTTDTEENEEKDNGSIIPSSRIKNYINKEKLNKELDTLIEKIKSSDSNLNLNTILSEDYQKKIGAVIKEKEEFNVKNPDAKVEINLNAIAVDVLSKHRFKFSNNSFKVLSVFSDMIVEEITKYAMDELVKNKKSIINNKYVFNSDIENGSLYNVYSKFPSFIAMKKEMSTVQAEVVESEQTEVSESEQTEKSNTKNINFEFYIRKICNKLKGTKEEYSKIKVSDKYQKLCSNIILDLLDQVAPLSKIILDVMSTKTITELVFQTIVKIQLWNGKDYDSVLDELNKRLEKK
jgi:hypothetical protein